MQYEKQSKHKDIPHFYQPDILETMTLGQEDSSHASRVLRLQSGDKIRVTDGIGHLYEATIAGGSKEVLLSGIQEIATDTAPVPPLHIAIAPTKNIDRIEWMVEKLCEVGLRHLSIVNTEHTIRKNVNLTRLEKVIISAVKQSRKVFMTELDYFDSLNDFLRSPLAKQRFIGYCGDEFEKKELAQDFATEVSSVFLIGPEGDFSPSEVRQATDAGFVPAMFGRERLRTETAGLYAGMLHHILNTKK